MRRAHEVGSDGARAFAAHPRVRSASLVVAVPTSTTGPHGSTGRLRWHESWPTQASSLSMEWLISQVDRSKDAEAEAGWSRPRWCRPLRTGDG